MPPLSQSIANNAVSSANANVYLHYVYDLWTHRWRRKATGDVIVIRYADDTIVGFQHEHEAKAFLHDLQERMGRATTSGPPRFSRAVLIRAWRSGYFS
jgi:RNA-directed DNA polymerase